MPTTYVAAITLAEWSRVTDTNPRGWVDGFDKDPAKFLQDRAQPFADAGIRLLFHRAFGAGGTTRTFSKRFDDQPASVTVVEWMPSEPDEQMFALHDFLFSPGVNGTFLYIGAPAIGCGNSLEMAARRITELSTWFPGAIPLYDNTGDIDSSELCAGSALFAAHDAMEREPFKAIIPWGIEPNPAVSNTRSPIHLYTPHYVYGTPWTWTAATRKRLENLFSDLIPIVAIRGDDYRTPAERLAAAREWGLKVTAYNGIVVVHGVSVEQMKEVAR